MKLPIDRLAVERLHQHVLRVGVMRPRLFDLRLLSGEFLNQFLGRHVLWRTRVQHAIPVGAVGLRPRGPSQSAEREDQNRRHKSNPLTRHPRSGAALHAIRTFPKCAKSCAVAFPRLISSGIRSPLGWYPGCTLLCEFGLNPMKPTLLVLFILCAATAFGQGSVLSNQPQIFSIPDHPQHADHSSLACEHPLVGGGEGTYTYAHGELPLWGFGSPHP